MTRVTESNDLHIDFLQELLSAGHELEPTLGDDNLPSEAEELKSKYLSKYKTAVVAAQASFLNTLRLFHTTFQSIILVFKKPKFHMQDAVHPVTREVKRLREDFLLETGAWYEHVVNSTYSDANAEVNFPVH